MHRGKPVIGIVGGIGSGKSFVARLFGELGCLVIDSDEQVRAAYQRADVQAMLRRWWGEAVFHADGTVNRSAIAHRVFADEVQRRRLEELLHPVVAQMRDAAMEAAVDDPAIVGFVWDTPLLLEAGLRDRCDALVFVDAPVEVRRARVREERGWDLQELVRRENLQLPLDTKREISDYILKNTAEADNVRDQVRQILSRILARSSRESSLE